MKINKILQQIILFISVVLLVLGLHNTASAAESKDSFWVEYVDVGQGDCALVQCDGHYMMIDGGPSKASSTVYTILKNKGIKTIDLMVATHPDEDHIGGLSGALNYSKVDKVLSPVTEHDTKTFKSLEKYVKKQGKSFTVPKVGDTYRLGSAKIDIVGPIYSNSDSNNQSIVVNVTYGANSFLFTGDAEDEEESSILRKYKSLKCDVLKVGHHGSNSSTSKALLNTVKPTYAVISVGENLYGHPTQSTIDKLTKAGVAIYRTDLQGDITFYSDGKNVTVETEKKASPKDIAIGGSKKKVGNKPTSTSEKNAAYVVNGKNGKIHIVGGCSSPPKEHPIYVKTYEEAEAESIRVAPNQKKRKCGNCY